MPAVNGIFYPDDKVELAKTISDYINQAPSVIDKKPIILASPHAGFIYSGQTAGVSYRQLKNLPKEHHTIVLVGPSHRIGFEGFAFPFSDSFATPLGIISVNQEKIHYFLSKFTPILPVFKHDMPHKDEHCLETQLPFLQQSLDNFDIIPIVYGKSDYNHLSMIFEHFLSYKNTIVVVSTDLSHYHDYETAKIIDNACNDGVAKLDLEQLSNCEACGITGLKAAVEYAKKHNLHSTVLDYKTSGDTAGDKAKVVGYASYMFYKE